ncbi:MAG: hypothetical protein JKX94_10210 [Sneathiella sp.]|nr:hypothetical protein [Sneathiella sp.]
MSAKKMMIASGVVLLIAVSVTAASIYMNDKVNNNLAAALKSVGSGATGKLVSAGGSHINVFTGEGSIQNLTVPNSAGEAAGNIFELEDVSFKVSPVSLFFGTVTVENLTVGKFTMDMKINGTKTSLASIVAAAGAYAAKGGGNFSDVRLIVEKFQIGKGTIKTTLTIPGRTIKKNFVFPPLKMAAIGANEGGIAPAVFAKQIITEVGSRAIKIAIQ